MMIERCTICGKQVTFVQGVDGAPDQYFHVLRIQGSVTFAIDIYKDHTPQMGLYPDRDDSTLDLPFNQEHRGSRPGKC